MDNFGDWPTAMLTVAWVKRSAGPGARWHGYPLTESQIHLLCQRGGVKLAFSQSEGRPLPSWGGALLAPGYGESLAFSQHLLLDNEEVSGAIQSNVRLVAENLGVAFDRHRPQLAGGPRHPGRSGERLGGAARTAWRSGYSVARRWGL